MSDPSRILAYLVNPDTFDHTIAIEAELPPGTEPETIDGIYFVLPPGAALIDLHSVEANRVLVHGEDFLVMGFVGDPQEAVRVLRDSWGFNA